MKFLQNMKRMRTTDETPIEEVEELCAYVEGLLIELKEKVVQEKTKKQEQMRDYFIYSLQKVIVDNCMKHIIVKEVEKL